MTSLDHCNCTFKPLSVYKNACGGDGMDAQPAPTTKRPIADGALLPSALIAVTRQKYVPFGSTPDARVTLPMTPSKTSARSGALPTWIRYWSATLSPVQLTVTAFPSTFDVNANGIDGGARGCDAASPTKSRESQNAESTITRIDLAMRMQHSDAPSRQ